MSTVSPKDIAKALARQQALVGQAWIDRCDDLAVQQRVMFLELVTFARDGVAGEQFQALINFLSVLQFLAKDHSEAAAAPVAMPEFRESVERAVLFFKTMETDDTHDQTRMAAAWYAGIDRQGEPVIWAVCIQTLQSHGILVAPLAVDMGITLYAVADVFSRRLADVKRARRPNG